MIVLSPAEKDLLRGGLAQVRISGRLEPFAGCSRVWLDVGHNPHAAQAIATTLKNLELQPRFCVLGMLRDKDVKAVAMALDNGVQAWCCAGIEGERGQSGNALAQAVSKVSGSERTVDFENVTLALNYALENSNPDEVILVFGSFITVTQAAAFLTGNC